MVSMIERKPLVLIGISVVCIAILLWQEAIPQDQSYFVFADARTWFGIQNAWNVLSNLGFLVAAILAVPLFMRFKPALELRLYVRVFICGVFVTGFGSAWFHWAPNNASLVWDRLPMTIAFSSFIVCVLHDYVTNKARIWFWPAIAFSVASVFFWYWTETLGRGDLRPYVLVQFLPLLLLPAIMLMYQPKNTHRIPIVIAFVFYILAKITEHYDGQIYELTQHFVSGHSLKHLLAAVASFYILKACLREA